jgi:hypothetical protein
LFYSSLPLHRSLYFFRRLSLAHKSAGQKKAENKARDAKKEKSKTAAASTKKPGNAKAAGDA